MFEKELILDECKKFFDKYKEFFPETIYYKGWLNAVKSPSMNTLKHVMEQYEKSDKQNFRVAEIGIGAGATTYILAKLLANKGELHIFDYEDSVVPIKKMINLEGYNNLVSHSNSYKIFDSYNFSLFELIKVHGRGYFNYIFLDGAHTFPVDGLAFYLCDILLKQGGYLELDDYSWTLKGHIDSNSGRYRLDDRETKFHQFAKLAKDGYTDQQLAAKQLSYIIDTLIPLTNNYKEIVPKRIYLKLG